MLAILSENSEAITAIATIIISSIAVIISIITYKGQKKLTIQSARPFLSFNLVDLSDRISIEVENNGLGVAIIKSTSFGSMSSGQVKDSLIDLVESIDDTDNPCFDDRTIWKRYEEGLCKKAIAPQSKRYLLELTSKDSSN